MYSKILDAVQYFPQTRDGVGIMFGDGIQCAVTTKSRTPISLHLPNNPEPVKLKQFVHLCKFLSCGLFSFFSDLLGMGNSGS